MAIAIKNAIENHGHTIARVAEILGVTDQAVRNWIGDGRPDPDNARRLIALLPGLTWDEIYPARKKASGE